MAHATRLLQHHRSIHIFSSTFPHVSSRFLTFPQRFLSGINRAVFSNREKYAYKKNGKIRDSL